MNGRQNLYRLQHWQLAERQRYLSDLEALAARLRADLEQLTREVDEGGASDTAAYMNEVVPIAGALHERRVKLIGTITEIDAQIIEAQEAVTTALQEVKLAEGAAAYHGFTFDDRRVRRSRRSI